MTCFTCTNTHVARRFVICYPDLILSRTMCVCESVCVRVRGREGRSTGSAGRPIADTLTRRHANDRTTIPLMTELFCKLADHFDVTLRALACRQDGRKTETALKVDVLVSERVVDGWGYVCRIWKCRLLQELVLTLTSAFRPSYHFLNIRK